MEDKKLSKDIADFSKTHDPNVLIASDKLPQWILDIPTPAGIVLAADKPTENRYELEGDINALNLIDLDKEGLGEYNNTSR